MRSLGEIALFTDAVDGVAAFYRELVGAAPVAEWPGGALFAIGGAPSSSSTSAPEECRTDRRTRITSR